MSRCARTLAIVCAVILYTVSCTYTHAQAQSRMASGSDSGDWLPIRTICHDLPPETSLHYLSAGIADNEVIAAGAIVPYWDAPSEIPSYPVLFRFDGKSVEPPPIPPSGAFPRITTSPEGHIYLFWGEPDGTDTTALRSMTRGTITSVWYSVYARNGQWSRPVELVRDTMGIWWYQGMGSMIHSLDGSVHLALTTKGFFSEEMIHAIVPPTGIPRIHRTPAAKYTVSYTAIDVRNDTILIAYSGEAIQEGNPRLRVILTRSEDRGRTWKEQIAPELMSIPDARQVNFTRTPDGHLHLVIGQTALGSIWVDRFRHFSSPDNGITWKERGQLEVPPGAQDPQLLPDPSGHLHFAFRDTNSRGSRVLYARWDGSNWSKPANPVLDYQAMYFTLIRDSGTLHLVFTNSTEDSALLGWTHLPADGEKLPPPREPQHSTGRCVVSSQLSHE